jgi:Family of unknown function (DUF5670)
MLPKESHMFIGIGILLLAAWILGFVVFHVSAFAIHLLIIAAVVAFVMHFFSGRTAAV